MDNAPILTAAGKEKGKVDLAPTLFAAPVNEALIHQAVVRQLAGKRVTSPFRMRPMTKRRCTRRSSQAP